MGFWNNDASTSLEVHLSLAVTFEDAKHKNVMKTVGFLLASQRGTALSAFSSKTSKSSGAEELQGRADALQLQRAQTQGLVYLA